MYDDGDVTAKESAVLVGLRRQLGISEQEATAIETSVREHLGAPRRATNGISG